MHESGKEINGKPVTGNRQAVFDTFEKEVPSPLAGEGQGEGDEKKCQRSDLETNSKDFSKLPRSLVPS